MTTINQEEIQKFSKLADQWWDANGKFKPLHRFNPIRIKYIIDKCRSHFGKGEEEDKPLKNLKILDVGCGKGFLLHDLKSQNPKIEVTGIDVSAYAIENAMDTVKSNCHIGCASELPFNDNSFDLVISINTLHNLGISKLWTALSELGRVSKSQKFVCVESFRNEKEKVNLLYWQLTCRAFYTPDDWRFLFSRTGYTGDYEFIYFQ